MSPLELPSVAPRGCRPGELGAEAIGAGGKVVAVAVLTNVGAKRKEIDGREKGQERCVGVVISGNGRKGSLCHW